MFGPEKQTQRILRSINIKILHFVSLSSINDAGVDIKHGSEERVYKDGAEMALLVSSVVRLPTR